MLNKPFPTKELRRLALSNGFSEDSISGKTRLDLISLLNENSLLDKLSDKSSLLMELQTTVRSISNEDILMEELRNAEVRNPTIVGPTSAVPLMERGTSNPSTVLEISDPNLSEKLYRVRPTKDVQFYYAGITYSFQRHEIYQVPKHIKDHMEGKFLLT